MRKSICLMFVFYAVFFAAYAQTVIIQDGLQGSTKGRRVGGSFSSEGYRPGIGFNHILYDVPRQVREGYVEFQVKGFARSLMRDPNGGADADNGFIGMYDGRGSSEPIRYINNFKYNFFRWNFHYRQALSRVKSVIDCANPEPGNLTATQAWHDCPQNGTCSDRREWYAEPTGSTYNFSASTWYTIRITWRSKTFKITINGTQVWGVSGPNYYNPIDFKIWLGAAPGYGDKYGNWVPGTTYRNFKLVSYSGGSTALEDVSQTQELANENQPAEYKLFQNYPNPFNPSTKIRFGVASPADVSIKIFNELGEIISEPVNSFYNPGYYEISVNMDNFAAGVYFYRISSGNFIAVKKMLLIK